MSIEALLAELRRLEIRLWTEDGRLLFSAPRGALTDELRERIRAQKAELVVMLDRLQARQRPEPQAGAGQRREELAPLSFAQSRLWFLAQMEPDSGGYNIPIALMLEGGLQVSILEAALNRVVARHEILRTTFVVENERPAQRVHPALAVRIETVEVEPALPGERQALARRRLEQEALRPFDLERGPLLRALLLRLDSRQHVLLLTLHHIIGDGWSLAILNRELSACYNALLQGREPALAPLRHQYADYARWQHEQLRGRDLQRLLGYWKARLEGLERFRLPADRPRPARASMRGDSIRFAIAPGLWAALNALCSRHAVTPFMLLLAAFSVLLHRYVDQNDIAVGTAIAGRQHEDFEGLIGFFVNTLVMRTDLSGDPSFSELLRRVRDTALDAYEHQGLPFERLVEELAPARDGARNPVFQVMFAFQNAPESPLELHGLTVSRFPLELRSEKFELSLTMRAEGEGLAASLAYSSEVFEAATIERMAACLHHLLESIVADPGQPIHALNMLGDDELRHVLVEWNATGRDYDGEQCVHAMIEQQAARTPHRTAVVCGNARISYAELNARANQLAHFLRAEGVVPDQLVGLCVRPSLEMVIAIVGVLKAGGAYVPLDPGYPADRLAFMLEDSAVPIVLGTGELSNIGAAPAVRILRLDRDREQIARYPAENPAEVVGGSNLAYMIYTSGSTGTPKGVLIEHRSVGNLAQGLRERYGLDATAPPLRNCLGASISFDASVDNWVMLGFGDELHVIDEELRVDSVALLRYLREQQIDVFDCTPTQLGLMLDEGLLDGTWVPRIIGVGGEALDPQTWGRLASSRRTAAYNLYGPTECTVEVTVARIDESSPVPVLGRPLANARVYLLDGYGNPVPPGATGEIFIGGDGLARGYHRRPELTAARFAMHTLPGLAPQRLYRSGDFGRYLPDGSLCFLGRRDGLIKLRGHTIEPGEVEAVLQRLPDVRDAVVMVRDDDPHNAVIVAYVRRQEAATVLEDELRNFLRSKLPAHMVPAAFVILDRFPVTPSGKIDLKGLPRPELGRRDAQLACVPATTDLQRQLVAIWRLYLEAERIGIDDDFFALGGHSLLATRVINRINRDCGVHLPLRLMFEQPTIRGMAAAIEERGAPGDTGKESDRIAAQPRVARKRPKPGQ